MEPLTDYELDCLLNAWVAPDTPRNLEQKVFSARATWWRRLFSRPLLHHWRRNKRLRKA